MLRTCLLLTLALCAGTAAEERIPTFFNLHIDAAKKWVQEKGVKARVVVVKQYPLFPGNGIIGQQDPMAGSVVTKDTLLTVYVSSGSNWDLNMDANDASIAYQVSDTRRKSGPPRVLSQGAGSSYSVQDFFGYAIKGTIGGKMATEVELISYGPNWWPVVVGSRSKLGDARAFAWEGVAGPNEGLAKGMPLELRIYGADGRLLAWDRMNR